MGSWIMLFLVSIVITPVRMETTDAVGSKERYIYFMTLITWSFITKARSSRSSCVVISTCVFSEFGLQRSTSMLLSLIRISSRADTFT